MLEQFENDIDTICPIVGFKNFSNNRISDLLIVLNWRFAKNLCMTINWHVISWNMSIGFHLIDVVHDEQIPYGWQIFLKIFEANV